jgi:NADH-ubiquinone oxidoreductase chain 1
MINLNFFASISNVLFSLAEVLSVTLPVLLAVAFMTILERKQLAAHQRRIGPNVVGYYGVLQPFSDALKLILKETIIPSQANKIIFYLAPVSTLIFSLLGLFLGLIKISIYARKGKQNILLFLILRSILGLVSGQK